MTTARSMPQAPWVILVLLTTAALLTSGCDGSNDASEAASAGHVALDIGAPIGGRERAAASAAAEVYERMAAGDTRAVCARLTPSGVLMADQGNGCPAAIRDLIRRAERSGESDDLRAVQQGAVELDADGEHATVTVGIDGASLDLRLRIIDNRWLLTGAPQLPPAAGGSAAEAGTNTTGDGDGPASLLSAADRPPRAERPQSRVERRVASLAWRLQETVARKDYAATCALLAAPARKELRHSNGSCPAGVADAAREAEPRPRIAWVRKRGQWASVVVRRQPDDALALTFVLLEDGKWRFPTLKAAGIGWP